MKPDTELLAEQLGAALLARDWYVTCAESCTGGGVAAAITGIAGSSQWFEAGFVTYSNTMKQHMLGVSNNTLEQHGAVSEAAVREMVQGAMNSAGADLAVAVSGIAGPDGGSIDKPVGTVWFAWQCKDGQLLAERCHFSGNRCAVRRQAIDKALLGLLTLAE